MIALAGHGAAEEAPDQIAGFPDLVDQVRTHWIEGKTLFYVSGQNIALRDLQSGTETFVPFGNYEIKELIVRNNEITLTAKSPETFWDKLSTRIRFAYDAENDVYNGIICKINIRTCEVAVSGNYLMRSFQPYAGGYTFTKTEWDDYSFGADRPSDVYSSVMRISQGLNSAVVEEIGGIQSMYVHEASDSVYLDVRNASKLTFQPGEGVFELVGGLVKKIYLHDLDERYKNLYGGQLRTNGRSWAIGFRRVVKGNGMGIYSYLYCSGKRERIDAISSIFLYNDVFFYIDLKGILKERLC